MMFTNRINISKMQAIGGYAIQSNTLKFSCHQLRFKIHCMHRRLSTKLSQNTNFINWTKKRPFGCNQRALMSSIISSNFDSQRTTAPSAEENVAEAVAPSEDYTSSLSAEDQRRLQLLRLELEVFRQSGLAVPQKLTDGQWKEVMEASGKFGRLKLYRYFCIRDHRKEKEKQEKERKQQELARVRQERTEKFKLQPFDGLEYGLCRNTLFIRLSETSMASVYNSWLCQAIMFGQKLVVDFGYSQHMVKRDLMNCCDQIQEVYGANRQNRQPFHLHFCNLSKDDPIHEHLLKGIPNLYMDNFLVTITEKSYLDLFPKERLVYLTPHCHDDLMEYNHDDIYIVGGLVDKSIQKPLSLAKAKKEGLRMARLPLDHYLDWGCGNKSLTLDQVLKILLDAKNTGDWNAALKHIPKRKLKAENEDFEKPKFNRKLRERKIYSGIY